LPKPKTSRSVNLKRNLLVRFDTKNLRIEIWREIMYRYFNGKHFKTFFLGKNCRKPASAIINFQLKKQNTYEKRGTHTPKIGRGFGSSMISELQRLLKGSFVSFSLPPFVNECFE
jgi:hypothetical protein